MKIEPVVAAMPRHPTDALRMLLGMWGRAPDARLADLIERYGRWISGALPPLRARTPAELEALWLTTEAQRRNTDVERLGLALGRGSNRAIRTRLDALLRRPSDPRWTPWLLELASRQQRMTDHAWRGWIKLAAHGRDPRLREALIRIRADLVAGLHAAPDDAGWHEAGIARIDRLTEVFPEADPLGDELLTELADAVERIVRQPSPSPEGIAAPEPPPTVDLLLEAVLAAPGDVEAVEVWADGLIEAGDPWGELVQTQLALEGSPDRPELIARERRLVRKHGTARLGPLVAILDKDTVRFRRGLLDVAYVRPKGKAQRELLGHAAFRSVRQLHSTTEHLLDPRLALLERIGLHLLEWSGGRFPEPTPLHRARLPGPGIEQLLALAGQDRPLGVRAMAIDLRGDGRGRGVGGLTGLPGLPELAELHVRGRLDPGAALLRSPLMGRLCRLVLEGTGLGDRIGALLDTLRAAGARPTLDLVLIPGDQRDTVRIGWEDGRLRVDVQAPFRFSGAELQGVTGDVLLVLHHRTVQSLPVARFTRHLPVEAEVIHLGRQGERLDPGGS